MQNGVDEVSDNIQETEEAQEHITPTEIETTIVNTTDKDTDDATVEQPIASEDNHRRQSQESDDDQKTKDSAPMPDTESTPHTAAAGDTTPSTAVPQNEDDEDSGILL